LRKYEAKRPDYFHFIHKENGGHGSVINFGAKLVKTKYFKVIDGDDWIDVDQMVDFLNFLNDCDDDIVINNFNFVTNGKRVESKSCYTDSLHDETGIRISKLGNYNIAFHSATVKTSLWVKNNIHVREHVFYDDQEYCLFPLEYANSLAFSHTSVYQYRIGQEGQSVNPYVYSKNYSHLYLVTNDCLDMYFRLKDTNVAVANYIGNRFSVIRGFVITVMFDSRKDRNVSKEKKANLKAVFHRIKNDEYLSQCFESRMDKMTKIALFFRFCFLRQLKIFYRSK
jgi:Glycosyl transferase family 2.